MKKLILMLAIAGFITASYAQNLMPGEVPPAVSKSFTKTHANAESVEWSKIGEKYQASYMADAKQVSVLYDASGKLKETEKEITLSKLPTPVLKYVNDNYPGEVVKKPSMITSSNGKTSYCLIIKQMDLAFDSNGKFISQANQ
jgi:hypothetical protein